MGPLTSVNQYACGRPSNTSDRINIRWVYYTWGTLLVTAHRVMSDQIVRRRATPRSGATAEGSQRTRKWSWRAAATVREECTRTRRQEASARVPDATASGACARSASGPPRGRRRRPRRPPLRPHSVAAATRRASLPTAPCAPDPRFTRNQIRYCSFRVIQSINTSIFRWIYLYSYIVQHLSSMYT